MDLSRVGAKFLSSVRSARSLALLPSTSGRPDVPARVAAAAAVARALASLPPEQRLGLPSSSAELSSMYETGLQGPIFEDLEEEFYEEDFDPIVYTLSNIPAEVDEMECFQNKATIRLAQLDRISARLSHHVMEHHEEMVKGIQLVKELERDLKIATIICMNGRRRLASSVLEVSRDLIVTTNSKKKQALLDLLPILAELCHALNLQKELEALAEEGNFCKGFQVLSEFLQLVDSLSDLSVVQQMSLGVEAWLGNTLQKLDSLLLQVCQVFKEEKYITVTDAYALIGDVSGLAEKIRSFFMQEVLSETHSALKIAVLEDQNTHTMQTSSRFTYGDLSLQIPESKFRLCLLRVLAVLFRLMCSYHAIMSFKPGRKKQHNKDKQCEMLPMPGLVGQSNVTSKSCESGVFSAETPEANSSTLVLSDDTCDNSANSCGGSPWYDLRKDAASLVSQSLERGRNNLWQLSTSRVSVLLSSTSFCSTSIHQFVRIYEDLNIFVVAGESFCGVEAAEFRTKLKAACDNYYNKYHKHNVSVFMIVLDKEGWQKLPADVTQVVSFAGLVGDEAPSVASSDVGSMNARLRAIKVVQSAENRSRKSGFSYWRRSGNPFLTNVSTPLACNMSHFSGDGIFVGSDGSIIDFQNDRSYPSKNNVNLTNGDSTIVEDENEDLLADFIDEDSQLPSRSSQTGLLRSHSLHWKDDEATTQTGSSLCLLRFMDKYARLMRKLGTINVEFFKGLCQLFEIYYYFVFKTFGHQDSPANGKGVIDSLSYRLTTAMNIIAQDCEQWLKAQPLLSPSSSLDPTGASGSTLGLKERCTAVDTISFVSRILHRSKPHLQSMLLQNNPVIVEDFFVNLVDTVPDLVEHIQRTAAKSLLHIDGSTQDVHALQGLVVTNLELLGLGYIDRIANVKWEVKVIGLENNSYVDLLLGDFKHYRTRLANSEIHKEVQEQLLEYGVEMVAETLTEGLSRVKRCSDEGRALMSLDLQVLINGLQQFVSKDVKPKLQIVETLIKAYYLSATDFVNWAHSHPQYSKSQVAGLVNLVAYMKGWRRKTRLEIIGKLD